MFLHGRIAVRKQAYQEMAALIKQGCERFRPYIDCAEYAAWAVDAPVFLPPPDVEDDDDNDGGASQHSDGDHYQRFDSGTELDRDEAEELD